MEEYPKIYLYRRVVQAKLYIDGHYSDAIDLDNIAGEAAYSRYHFLRLFRQIYSKTPHQYLTRVRIEQAKLLLDKNLPITDVCFSVGFDSISSFTGLFKKRVGITPSAYRERQQQRKAELTKQPLQFIPNCFAESKGWTKYRNFQEAL